MRYKQNYLDLIGCCYPDGVWPDVPLCHLVNPGICFECCSMFTDSDGKCVAGCDDVWDCTNPPTIIDIYECWDITCEEGACKYEVKGGYSCWDRFLCRPYDPDTNPTGCRCDSNGNCNNICVPNGETTIFGGGVCCSGVAHCLGDTGLCICAWPNGDIPGVDHIVEALGRAGGSQSEGYYPFVCEDQIMAYAPTQNYHHKCLDGSTHSCKVSALIGFYIVDEGVTFDVVGHPDFGKICCANGKLQIDCGCATAGGDGCTTSVGANEIPRPSGDGDCIANVMPGTECIACAVGYSFCDPDNNDVGDCQPSCSGECTDGISAGETETATIGDDCDCQMQYPFFINPKCITCDAGYVWDAVSGDCIPAEDICFVTETVGNYICYNPPGGDPDRCVGAGARSSQACCDITNVNCLTGDCWVDWSIYS